MADYRGAAEFFAALSSPGRLAVLAEVARAPRLVGALARDMGLSQPEVSRALSRLRRVGLAHPDPRGRVRVYRVTDRGRRALDMAASNGGES
jgi:DNA-binding transcriptional ArsR family regulator